MWYYTNIRGCDMQIFYFDKDPEKAAKALDDDYIIKQPNVLAQFLSTTHRVLDGKAVSLNHYHLPQKWILPDSRDYEIFDATQVDHPLSIWCRESLSNYYWVVENFYASMREYKIQYGEYHDCFGQLSYILQSPPLNLRESAMTPIISYMPEEFIISDDPIVNYRNYYVNGKVSSHLYEKRKPPEWMTFK
jgi:hypothetical protein